MSINTNSITRLEQEIIAILRTEYSFYQSLYILLDKQRDIIKYDKEENLLDLFSEIERCQNRIKESERKITILREQNQKMFRVAAAHPDAKKLMNSIVTIIRKNLKLVHDNESYAVDRHHQIQVELEELQNSEKILQYVNNAESSSMFLDGKS